MKRLATVAVVLALPALASGCGPMARPTEIAIGGVREPITREELAAARGMPGGLLEPTWLPDSFELVQVSFDHPGDAMRSADLVYQNGRNYVHIWQTNLSPEDLGAEDPLSKGEPLEGTSWNANALPAAQVGAEGVVEYTSRLSDGRTVSVDSDLEAGVIRRVLNSLELRADGDEE